MKRIYPFRIILCSLLIIVIVNNYSYPQDNYSHLAPEAGITSDERALWDISVAQEEFSRIIDIVLENTKGTIYPPGSSQALIFGKKKEDFLKLWRENPKRVNPQLQRLAEYLAINAKYVAMEFLYLLIEAPELLEEIPDDIIYRKEELDKYISRRLQEIKIQVPESEIYNTQVDFLANTRRLGLVKIALIMGRGKGSLADINIVGSNISLGLLRGAYLIAEDLINKELGKPSSRFAILLTGSNSRNEYPFSDYDAIGVYEKGGKTDKGKSNQFYFDTLYREIGGIMNNIGCDFDISVSPFHSTTADFNRYSEELQARKQYASGLYPLVYGAGGDRGWGEEVLASFNKLFYEGTDTHNLLAQLAFVREERPRLHSEYYQRDNIKYFRGGLADGFDLYRIYKLIKGITDNDIFGVFKRVEGVDPSFEEIRETFEYLCWIKVRLELHYGDNHKFLPKGKELEIFARSLGYSGGARALLRDLVQKMALFDRLTTQAIKMVIGNMDWESLVRQGGRLEEGVEVGTTVFIDREEMDPGVGRTLDLLRAKMGFGGGETAYQSPRTYSDRLSPKEEAREIKDDLVDYLKRVFGLEVSVKIDSPKRVIWPKVSWKSKEVKAALARAKEIHDSDEEAIDRLRGKIRGGLAYKRKSLEPLSVVLRTREGDIVIHDDDSIILDHKIARERVPESVKNWVVEFDGSLDELGLELDEEKIIYRYQTPVGVQGISSNWRVLLEVMRLTDIEATPGVLTDGRAIDTSL